MLDATLFVVSLLVNIFFLPFCGILIWNCIKHNYLLAVYTLNTSSSKTFTFLAVLWPSKHQSYLSSYFETSQYLSWYLVYCFLLLNIFFMLFFAVLSINSISGTYLVAFQPAKTSFVLCFQLLIFRLLNTKYIHCTSNQEHLSRCTLTSKNTIHTLPLAFSPLLTFFASYLRFVNA